MTTRTAAQKKKKALRKKLIRLALDHPEKRAEVMPLIVKMAGDKMPKDLLDKFKGKDDKDDKGKDDDKKADKKAGMSKVAIKPETEEFMRWVMSTQPPMSSGEVASFINRSLGIKTSPPVKRRGGDRFQRGDSVIIKAKKHKSSKFDRGNYDLYDGKTGTVVGTEGQDAMVSFNGKPDVRFPGALTSRGVGIYKYTKAYTITGSAKIEMIYNAAGKSTSDAKVTVDAYVGRARGTEKRSANYYTGHVIFASVGSKGFYFRGFPQQRMDVDPNSEAGYQARTFNPSLGQVLYIGVFNSRPAKWKAELKKMDSLAEAEASSF